MSENGCRHVRTFDVAEGADLVTRCAASGCGAEVARLPGGATGDDDDDDYYEED